MPADLDLRRTLRAIWNGTRNPPAGGARDLTARILSRRNRSVGSQHSPSQAKGGGPPGACMLLQRQHRLWQVPGQARASRYAALTPRDCASHRRRAPILLRVTSGTSPDPAGNQAAICGRPHLLTKATDREREIDMCGSLTKALWWAYPPIMGGSMRRRSRRRLITQRGGASHPPDTDYVLLAESGPPTVGGTELRVRWGSGGALSR